MSTQLHFVGLYPIDLSQSSTHKIEIPDQEVGIVVYTNDLITTLLENQTNRLFKFRSLTTEVSGAVEKIANNGEYDIAPQTIADRLLSTEKATQQKYQRITELLKGSLVQASFTADGQKYVVVSKVDHHAFLDEADLTKHIGMPYKRRVLKACLIPIATDGTFERVSIYDTNLKIAEYWWKDFLELIEERSDEQNTKTAFYSMEHLLVTQVKPKSKADFTYLRNDLVSYFRTHSSFSHADLTSAILGNYTPSVASIDAVNLKAKAAQLPQQKKFDQQFDIANKVIKARYKNVIELRPNLELLMKADVPNLDAVIQPFKEKGVKGIKIFTEPGWEHFNRKAAGQKK
jgi:hypothetical protein